MELQVLIKNKYKVLAVTNRGRCDVENALMNGEASNKGVRFRLIDMLDRLSQDGFHNAVSVWTKPLDSRGDIHELKSGKMRLFYFTGSNGDLLICTSLGRKTTPRADKSAIAEVRRFKNEYEDALQNQTLVYLDPKESEAENV